MARAPHSEPAHAPDTARARPDAPSHAPSRARPRAWSVARAVAIKDATLLRRDPAALFFTLAFPVLFGLGFGLVFQQVFGERDAAAVRVALVDLDRTPASAAVAASLRASGRVELAPEASGEQAFDAVRRGEAAAALVLDAGFADAARTALVGDPITLRGWTDPGRFAEAAAAEGLIRGAVYRGIASAAGAPVGAAEPFELALVPASGLGPAGARTARDARPPAAFALTFPQAAAWGLVGCVIGFGQMLGRELHGPAAARLAAAPAPRWVVVLAKAAVCFAAGLLVLAWLTAVFGLAGARVSSWPAFAAAAAAAAFGFTGLIVALAGVTRGRQGAEGVHGAVVIVLALVGGAGIPIMYFRGWLELLPLASPFGWLIRGFEAATWRGLGLPGVLAPAAVLSVMGAAGLAAGVALLGREPRGSPPGRD